MASPCDWPYPTVELDTTSTPTWACPGGICDCHNDDGEPILVPHTIALFDERTHRLPSACCRIFENGVLINADDAQASAAGTIEVMLQKTTRSLVVEWAPAGCPRGPLYPFRKLYDVVVGGGDEGVRARLHNLGFVEAALDDSVRDFQRAYPTTDDPSGNPDDIDGQLRGYHDLALLPPVGTPGVPGPAVAGGTPSNGIVLAAFSSPGDDEEAGSDDEEAGSDDEESIPALGCVASAKTQKIRVMVATAFAIRAKDINKPATTTPEALGDMALVLKEYYGSNLTFRYRNPKQPTAIEDAVLLEPGLPPARTDSKGVATIDVSKLALPTTLEFEVRPPTDAADRLQLNVTAAPAGPSLAIDDADAAADHLYRPFKLILEVNNRCEVVASLAHLLGDASQSLINDKDNIHYAALIPPSKVPVAHAPSVDVVVDWKPDWIRGVVKKRPTLNVFSPPVPPTAPAPCIVLHHTQGVSLYFGAIAPLRKNGSTGIHYIVDVDGHIIKLIQEKHRSNHSGASQWAQTHALNQFSVGIEVIQGDFTPVGVDPVQGATYQPREFSDIQYRALTRLVRDLMSQHGIKRSRVISHRDVSLMGAAKRDLPFPNNFYLNATLGGKPFCNGETFPWLRLAADGLALNLGTVANLPADLQQLYTNAAAALNETKRGKTHRAVVPPGQTPQQVADALTLLRQALWDIGYSVAKAKKHQLTRAVLTLKVKNKHIMDDQGVAHAFLRAVEAFQTHYFSGKKRRFRAEVSVVPRRTPPTKANPKPPAPLPPESLKWPSLGHIDRETIRAIIEVWSDLQTVK
jgi:N-acetyl-anhydromuramyl-L-alanine amidase AmpD